MKCGSLLVEQNEKASINDMEIYEMSFSPTGGTRKVADVLAAAWSDNVCQIDLAAPHFKADVTFSEDDVVLIAVPSYAGRVPALAVERIRTMEGNNARAVLLCVYGNRAYEDTLIELSDVVETLHFRVVAAVAAIAEHSIVRHYGAGRPDADDKELLEVFAGKIERKLLNGDFTPLSLPGNRPYKPLKNAAIVPMLQADCNACGWCAKQCPVQAIDLLHPDVVNADKCMGCMRCVAYCPRSARKIPAEKYAFLDNMLQKVATERKTAELFC